MRLSKRHNLKTKQELTLLTLNARTKKIKRCSLIYKCQRRKDRINAASIIPNIRRINYLLVYIGRYSRKRTTLRCRMTSLSTTEKLRRLLYQRIIIAFASKSNNKAMHLKCLDILLKQSKSKICSHEVNILIKPIKLNRMHEIAVICDSEQFSRAYLHEASVLASGRHFVYLQMTTLFSFLNFQEKSGILSWFLLYFLNPYCHDVKT